MTQDQQLQCEETDCTRPGHECSYNDNDTGVPDYYYCTEHAKSHGFCWSCGHFWGGVESFEFPRYYGGMEGLCENCSGDLRTELREDQENGSYDLTPFEL